MMRRVALNGLRASRTPRIIDGAADRRAAAEQLARRRVDRCGEGFGARLVLDQRPIGDHDVQQRSGPLKHGDGDRLRGQRADRVQHLRIAERRRIALLLQFEAAHC